MIQQNKMACKQVSAINHLKADKGRWKLPFITYENNWAPFFEVRSLQDYCAHQNQLNAGIIWYRTSN